MHIARVKLLIHGSAHLAALNNKQEDKQSNSSVHESMYLTHHPVLNVFEVQPKAVLRSLNVQDKSTRHGRYSLEALNVFAELFKHF